MDYFLLHEWLDEQTRPIVTRSLENGIGPAKAFGCGLLLVRRLADD
ncbi:CRISPR-associated protein Cse3 family [Thiobaca trueperi]|uniref:CRISPR-associated protein Cse3 family n=1 Tax=Thiobaca trueperi TaxID=127458 RepID=A0A4R3N438_9GAMM|nr:CRISPR-associated protein Cse3 family [Thiobaca trueperi]